jgi:hypothetical protein
MDAGYPPGTPKQMWAGPLSPLPSLHSFIDGRRTTFHLLPPDCRGFVLFFEERDPVIVTKWQSGTEGTHAGFATALFALGC